VTRILRVFPRRTSHTPTGPLVAVGEPGLWLPEPTDFDEIHVSVTFTWDVRRAAGLAEAWEMAYPGRSVLVGGPAVWSPCDSFVPGRYVCPGITYTSRGCPNRCPWCLVPDWEGPLWTLSDVASGNVVQDNNFLACPRGHRRKVYEMLRDQAQVRFQGGLEAGRLTAWDVERIRGLRLKAVWLACDTPEAIGPLRRAIGLLAGLGRAKLRCYVLARFDPQETPDDVEGRCREVWAAGAMPFVQMYRTHGEKRKRRWPDEWAPVMRRWSRPAATKAHMRQVGLVEH